MDGRGPTVEAVRSCAAGYGSCKSQDVAFVKRMLQNMWVSVGSKVGETAACVLDRGLWQGYTDRQDLFISILNPAHVMIEARERGYSITALQRPADMLVLDWIGTLDNRDKSCISVINYAN